MNHTLEEKARIEELIDNLTILEKDIKNQMKIASKMAARSGNRLSSVNLHLKSPSPPEDKVESIILNNDSEAENPNKSVDNLDAKSKTPTLPPKIENKLGEAKETPRSSPVLIKTEEHLNQNQQPILRLPSRKNSGPTRYREEIHPLRRTRRGSSLTPNPRLYEMTKAFDFSFSSEIQKSGFKDKNSDLLHLNPEIEPVVRIQGEDKNSMIHSRKDEILEYFREHSIPSRGETYYIEKPKYFRRYSEIPSIKFLVKKGKVKSISNKGIVALIGEDDDYIKPDNPEEFYESEKTFFMRKITVCV
jgi:hypothetical protein